jgi:hypothetical protein
LGIEIMGRKHGGEAMVVAVMQAQAANSSAEQNTTNSYRISTSTITPHVKIIFGFSSV